MSTVDITEITIGGVTLIATCINGWVGEKAWLAISLLVQPTTKPPRVAENITSRQAFRRKLRKFWPLFIFLESVFVISRSLWEGLHKPLTLHIVTGLCLGVGGVVLAVLLYLAELVKSFIWTSFSILTELIGRIETPEIVVEDNDSD